MSALENQTAFRHYPLALLIAANLIPVVGVLFWGWSAFEIVALYWFENVVIGAVNILKLATACGEGRRHPNLAKHIQITPTPGILLHGAKLFMIPFFTFHYGMFCFVHGMFVFILLGGKGGDIPGGNPVAGMTEMIGSIFSSGGGWFVLAIIASHLLSFGYHFIGKGEFRHASTSQVMAAPYGRIVVLHLAIIFGAFVTAALGSPVFMLLLLIAGKIILDAKLHLRSHRKALEAAA